MFRGQSMTVKEEKEGPPMVSLNEVSSSRPCGSPHVVAQISDSLTDVLWQERENSPIEPSSEMGQPTQSQPITSRWPVAKPMNPFEEAIFFCLSILPPYQETRLLNAIGQTNKQTMQLYFQDKMC